MGIPIKPSPYLTAKDATAIKKGGHAQQTPGRESYRVMQC
jgi:hypothetical protein